MTLLISSLSTSPPASVSVSVSSVSLTAPITRKFHLNSTSLSPSLNSALNNSVESSVQISDSGFLSQTQTTFVPSPRISNLSPVCLIAPASFSALASKSLLHHPHHQHPHHQYQYPNNNSDSNSNSNIPQSQLK